MMENPEEKTMKEVRMEIKFNKSRKPLLLEERLNFLRSLPIMVYIEKDNQLLVNFEDNFVDIYPEKDVASFANFKAVKEIKDCNICLERDFPGTVYNKKIKGATFYFHTKSLGYLESSI